MFEEFLKELIGIISKYPKGLIYSIRLRINYNGYKYISSISPCPINKQHNPTILLLLNNLDEDYKNIKFYNDLINSICKESNFFKLIFELQEFRENWLLPREQQNIICEKLFLRKTSMLFTVRNLENLASKGTFF